MFLPFPHGVMAAHGSLEPFVLVRVQVGELETGPRGEAGTQIHLIHIQWHDERARPDRAMRPVFVLVRLAQVTRTSRSGKLTTGKYQLNHFGSVDIPSRH